MQKLARSLLLAGVAAGMVATAAQADDGVISYRKDVYMAIGGHTKALAAILKREVDFTEDAAAHAMALAALSQMVKHVFPEGSGKGDTQALPVIWEKPKEFAAIVDQFAADGAKLGDAASGGPKAIAPAFGAFVKNCKTCHDTFRKKDK